MKTTVIGYPRIGKKRELKFAIEKYWKGELTQAALFETAQNLRSENAQTQTARGLSVLPCNDFSFYDLMLDTACMLGAVPARYTSLGLSALDTYFAMARGYQGAKGDVKAFTMKKWFNTNYHYMVCELDADTKINLNATAFFERAEESKAATDKNGAEFRPSVIGPFTFLQLAHYKDGKTKTDFAPAVAAAYRALIDQCSSKGISWLQLDEPALVFDLSTEDITFFTSIYRAIFGENTERTTKILLQTYFGDVRDAYDSILELGFDGIGLDFVEGAQTKSLLEQKPLPQQTVLFAGIVNGKNIWKTDYKAALETIRFIQGLPNRTDSNIVLSSSCSLLHVPYSAQAEKAALGETVVRRLAFAEEKLTELTDLARLCTIPQTEAQKDGAFLQNQADLGVQCFPPNKAVQQKVASLTQDDFIRGGKNGMKRTKRQTLQRSSFNLPLLPTTTIGSFPQTAAVKHNRSRYKKGEITKAEYDTNVRTFIKDCIETQEKLDLDVLVHGESERNDMVEFFGENLAGFIFTTLGWVQSYGTRCVKPPIIAGDVSRTAPITVPYALYASSLTQKEVKGMLTGPVTILNWSFVRDDIPLCDVAFQIALAIRGEVLDLESSGVKIIQIDEAALREKLPLRKKDWNSKYLDWAIPAFRLCHSGVKNETQIHTHMCYSEFEDIVHAIDNMDADVITFEASRSKLSILDALKKAEFETETGPGVYDIHSPRVPSVEEIEAALRRMLEKIPAQKLWVNPDCGLKTRGEEETFKSLANMVQAAKNIRAELNR